MPLMNYHELTMNEPRDSPQRRKQFLFICTVMAAIFFYSAISAGIITPVTIIDDNHNDNNDNYFPGGTFIYKSNKRDYAAAPALQTRIVDDINKYIIGKDNKKQHIREQVDIIYTIYLDEPNKVPGGRNHRFASGILINDKTKSILPIENINIEEQLLLMNESIISPTRKEIDELPANELFLKLKYKKYILPKIKSIIVYFPYTDGFVSSLIISMKVIPTIRQYIHTKYNTNNIVIISTCSKYESMCTFYSPIEDNNNENENEEENNGNNNVKEFLLGQPNMIDYLTTLDTSNNNKLIDFDAVMAMARRSFLFGGGKKKQEDTTTTTSSSDEL